MKDATFKKGGFPTGEKKQVCKLYTLVLQLAYINITCGYFIVGNPRRKPFSRPFYAKEQKTFSLRNSTWNSYYVYKRYEKLFRNFSACGIKYVSFVPESILGETFFQRMRRKVITAAGPKRENKRKKVFRRKRFWKLLKGEFS